LSRTRTCSVLGGDPVALIPELGRGAPRLALGSACCRTVATACPSRSDVRAPAESRLTTADLREGRLPQGRTWPPGSCTPGSISLGKSRRVGGRAARRLPPEPGAPLALPRLAARWGYRSGPSQRRRIVRALVHQAAPATRPTRCGHSRRLAACSSDLLGQGPTFLRATAQACGSLPAPYRPRSATYNTSARIVRRTPSAVFSSRVSR
jgi:hypothetical protein